MRKDVSTVETREGSVQLDAAASKQPNADMSASKDVQSEHSSTPPSDVEESFKRELLWKQYALHCGGHLPPNRPRSARMREKALADQLPNR